MNELLEELKNNERVNFRTMAVKVRDVHVCVFNGCIVFKKAGDGNETAREYEKTNPPPSHSPPPSSPPPYFSPYFAHRRGAPSLARLLFMERERKRLLRRLHCGVLIIFSSVYLRYRNWVVFL